MAGNSLNIFNGLISEQPRWSQSFLYKLAHIYFAGKV